MTHFSADIGPLRKVKKFYYNTKQESKGNVIQYLHILFYIMFYILFSVMLLEVQSISNNNLSLDIILFYALTSFSSMRVALLLLR